MAAEERCPDPAATQTKETQQERGRELEEKVVVMRVARISVSSVASLYFKELRRKPHEPGRVHNVPGPHEEEHR